MLEQIQKIIIFSASGAAACRLDASPYQEARGRLQPFVARRAFAGLNFVLRHILYAGGGVHLRAVDSLMRLFTGAALGLITGVACGYNRRLNYQTALMKLLGAIPSATWLPVVMVLAD